jgi:hypothetical protein
VLEFLSYTELGYISLLRSMRNSSKENRKEKLYVFFSFLYGLPLLAMIKC